MPLFDFWCESCGQIARDVYRPISVGAQADPPICRCSGFSQRMAWIPFVQFIDAKEPFQEFTVSDGRNRPVLVDSLRKMRQVERESEQMARNGEGQPMVWRRYSQDRSNVHVHTLGENPQQAPTKEAAARFGATLRKSADAPEVVFGPGVNESNTSALKDRG